MVRKIFIYKAIILLLFLITPKAFANSIDAIINAEKSFSPAIISISVKDKNTGEIIYQKNPKILVHPASTLKIVTSSAALNYLGKDYNFKTALYRNGNKIYLKVGADPLFSYEDILNLVSQYKSKNTEMIKNFIIDDTIIDKESFGIGWQWDDNANIYFPQMSPYIINRNLFMVKANLSRKNTVTIEYAKEYKEPIINNISYGDTNFIKSTRDIFATNPKITLSGTIKENQIIYIPAKNPQQMYHNVLMYAFLSNNIPINANFKYEKLPRFCAEEGAITHTIEDVLKRINQNSDNLAAEILIKHAGSIKTDNTGTTQNGLEVVKNFYEENGIDMKNIIIVDASGASMNDYITSDFLTEALLVISKNHNFEFIKNTMSDPTNGTFRGRLPELNGKIKVKTGTHANTSSITGYITTNSGKDLVFAIILDNLPLNVNPKEFENKIIKAISFL